MKAVIPFAAAAASLLFGSVALAGQHFVIVERPVNEITTDVGPKGDSPGDSLTFANKVYDAANKVEVGSDHGFCVRVVTGKSWECLWTVTLKDGMITQEGPFMDEGDSLFAITGGTGKYAGAKGQMKLHPRDAKSTSYDFTYDLR